MLTNKIILITGGTGSLGRKLVQIIMSRYMPKKLIVFSRDELKQHEMSLIYPSVEPSPIRYFLGDVRDPDRLKMALEGVDYVIHAAALKQVPAAEYNPFEAVKTNVIGGQNVIEAALYGGVKGVVALSTDKACAPINLYGSTKLTSDKLFIAANNYRGHRDIRFGVVRYGNVMGSRGSVIPHFMKQRSAGELSITDERMTRFNITLTEGAELVLSALTSMHGGELFVPKLPSYRILDMARAIAPEARIKIIGIRPGEKIHEEMITPTDSLNALEFSKFFVILPALGDKSVVDGIARAHGPLIKALDYGFSYNSGTNDRFLRIDEIKDLIANNLDGWGL